MTSLNEVFEMLKQMRFDAKLSQEALASIAGGSELSCIDR